MDSHRASTSSSQQMPAPAPTFRPQQPKEVNEHIYQLYKPENGKPTIEILFFHGLQFEDSPDPPYLSTWTTENTSGSKEVWPGTWLAEEFPQAHIFSISYDASIRMLQDRLGESKIDQTEMSKHLKEIHKSTEQHERFDLYNLAENLVHAIGWAGIGQGFGRPVIFVGHSFGGLAIKQLWVQADQMHSRYPKSNLRTKKFLDNIQGVFFYGTPHRGASHLFDKAADFLDGPLIPYVKLLSRDSARLQEDFASMCRKYSMHSIASVGELNQTFWGDIHGVVVPDASARYGDFCTVATDHISLCKPTKKTSNSFQHLLRFIHDQRFTREVQRETSFEKIHPRVSKAAVGLDLGVENEERPVLAEELERLTEQSEAARLTAEERYANRTKEFEKYRDRSEHEAGVPAAGYSRLAQSIDTSSGSSFRAQNGHSAYVLSCYDAEVTYNCETSFYEARYPDTNLVEEGIPWERLRAPPVDTSPYDLYLPDSRGELRPGNHVEVQWRLENGDPHVQEGKKKKKKDPYGWYYAVVGHGNGCSKDMQFCECHRRDIVWLKYNQFKVGSQWEDWRIATIHRSKQEEEGNEDRGYHGGVRKLQIPAEISKWEDLLSEVHLKDVKPCRIA